MRPAPRSVGATRRIVGVAHIRQTKVTDTYIEVTETYSVVEPAPMTRPVECLSTEEKIEALTRALARAQVELKLERRSRRGLRKLTFIKVR